MVHVVGGFHVVVDVVMEVVEVRQEGVVTGVLVTEAGAFDGTTTISGVEVVGIEVVGLKGIGLEGKGLTGIGLEVVDV